MPVTDSPTLRLGRMFLLAIVVAGFVGVGAELIAMAHYEDAWQDIPIVLVLASVAVICWSAAGGGTAALRTLRVVMTMCVLAGVAGIVLHYRGSLAFQTDMDPSLRGWALFSKVVRAKAPPTLAPGVMAQLGLLGWLYTLHHPALTRAARREDSTHA